MENIDGSDIEAAFVTSVGNNTFVDALEKVVSGDDILCLLGRYINFNAIFASSVATLAGGIAGRQDIFRDADEVIEDLADRCVEVAMDIFFAAIDEFGGCARNHRKTHRSMAQATLKATAIFFGVGPERLNGIVRLNKSTRATIHKVQDGYGVNQTLDEHNIFHAIGFHLGSEMLADKEFRILDNFLSAKYPELVKYLRTTEVSISGVQHAAYHWIRIHTSVEAEHFDVAVKGANRALRYYAGKENKARIKSWIMAGLMDFTVVQAEFMAGLLV